MKERGWSADDGQMGIDFVTGMAIFIFTMIFVLQMMFGVVEPFTSTSAEHAGTVDRVGERLVGQVLADENATQGVVNYTKTMRFFDSSRDEIRKMLGVSPGTTVNVTLTSDFTSYGPRDGLVGYWPLNRRTSAIAPDASSLSSEGTAPAVIPPEGRVRRGVDGMMSSHGYDFQSDDGKLLVEPDLDMNVTRTQNVSVSFWMKNELQTGDNKDIIALMNGSDIVWGVYINGGEPGMISHSASGIPCTITSTDSTDTDTWNHVVYVHDNGTDTAKIYINGEEEDSSSCSKTFSAGGTELIVGHGTGVSDPGFNGTLDEIRLYDRPLTENDTEELFNASDYLTPDDAELGEEMENVTLNTGPDMPDAASVSSRRRIVAVPEAGIGPVEVRVRVW